MALPVIDDVKSYLRIQTTAEDVLLASLLVRAQAMVEAHMGRPIALESRTFTEEAESLVAYGRVTKLLVPVTPVDWSTLVLTDADGDALVITDDYRTGDAWLGEIRAAIGMSFGNAPYTIAVDVGLETAADYATRVEPVVSAAIVDVVADLYQRRSPAASTESTGGGISTTYTASGLPARTAAMLAPYTMVRVV